MKSAFKLLEKAYLSGYLGPAKNGPDHSFPTALGVDSALRASLRARSGPLQAGMSDGLTPLQIFPAFASAGFLRATAEPRMAQGLSGDRGLTGWRTLAGGGERAGLVWEGAGSPGWELGPSRAEASPRALCPSSGALGA